MVSASDPPRSLLTVAETAAQLRVDEKTVRRKIVSGDLPAVRIGSGRGGALRIDAVELDYWLEARRTTKEDA